MKFRHYVISSDANMVLEVNVLEHLGNRDHNVITWKLICDVGLTKTKLPVRQYHKANFVAMKIWFQEIDWVVEFDGLNVEDAWLKFCSVLDKATEQFVPLGIKKQRKTPRWMNKVTKSAMKYKSRMWHRYRESRS